MPKSVVLNSFFRIDGVGDTTIGPERYIAGFEDREGEPWGTTVPLDPADVETTVLGSLSLSVSMQTNGVLFIEAESAGDTANEAIISSSNKAYVPVDVVILSVLAPDHLALEDNAAEELGLLRDRLSQALQVVDDALNSMKK